MSVGLADLPARKAIQCLKATFNVSNGNLNIVLAINKPFLTTTKRNQALKIGLKHYILAEIYQKTNYEIEITQNALSNTNTNYKKIITSNFRQSGYDYLIRLAGGFKFYSKDL